MPVRATETLKLVRAWYANQLASTFALADCVVFRSVLGESQWQARHRRDGKADEIGIWVARIREAATAGAISIGDRRVNYYISRSPSDAGRYGWALYRENFGHGAYMAVHAVPVLVGDQRSRKMFTVLDGPGAVAGLMAHELAHCFATAAGEELPNRNMFWDSNVMGPSYLRFPNCRLDSDQKMLLLQSPFLTIALE